MVPCRTPHSRLMAGSESEGEALGGGFGFVSRTAGFLWHHIPSFGQFKDAEPSCWLSLGTEGEGGRLLGTLLQPGHQHSRLPQHPAAPSWRIQICKLIPKSGMHHRRLPLENLLPWLSLWDAQSLSFHLTLHPLSILLQDWSSCMAHRAFPAPFSSFQA